MATQIKDQLGRYSFRQRNTVRQFLGRSLIESKSLAHDDLEPTFSIANDPEHLLVGTASQEWLKDDDRPMRQLRLAPNSIEPAGTLFNGAGVPAQIVMDDVTTKPVKVGRLPHRVDS